MKWRKLVSLAIVITVVILACGALMESMDARETERNTKSCDEYVATLDLLGHQFTHRHGPCQILVVHQEGDNLFYIWVDRDDFQSSIEEQAAGLE